MSSLVAWFHRMSRLREIPVVYGPTRATSEALRARCVELGVDFAIQGDPTPKGREVMFVLGEDPREGIAPLALPAQVYNTRAHQELLNALFAKTKSLKNDDFAFKNGVAAFAIAGAMGEFSYFLFLPWSSTHLPCSCYQALARPPRFRRSLMSVALSSPRWCPSTSPA